MKVEALSRTIITTIKDGKVLQKDIENVAGAQSLSLFFFYSVHYRCNLRIQGGKPSWVIQPFTAL